MTSIDNASIDKKRIRQVMREKRAQLPYESLTLAAKQLAHNAQYYPPLLKANKIASYLPTNGEISPHGLQQALSAQFFLPRITNISDASMRFYCADNRLTRNSFNILEPVAEGNPQTLQGVDVVLMPLVAFDKTGNRLGMGGGFYDRALAFKKELNSSKAPHLIGLAHHFQEVEQLPTQSWDIPLNAILTDQELIKIRR